MVQSILCNHLQPLGVLIGSGSSIPSISLRVALNSLLIVLTLLVEIAGLGGLYRLRKAAQGTTLQAVWWWTLAAWICVGGATVGLSGDPSAAGTHLQYAAGIASFCPLMALLGAKRPQNSAWGWVVATLVVILILPSLEQRLFWPSASLRIEGARSWFLLLLIGLSWSIYLPTRHWPSSLLTSMGQSLLLWVHFPWAAQPLGPLAPVAALGLWGTALALVVLGWPKSRQAVYRNDQVWRDFRNQFGLLWGLRVAERFNAAAQSYGWKFRLGWWGFQFPDDATPSSFTPELQANINAVLDNLLLKFVSAEWIAKRRNAP